MNDTYRLNSYLESLEKLFFNSSENIVILDKRHQDVLFNNYITVRKEYENLGESAPRDAMFKGWRYELSPRQDRDKVTITRSSTNL